MLQRKGDLLFCVIALLHFVHLFLFLSLSFSLFLGGLLFRGAGQKDIADEERVHAGEFLRLLHELAPDEEKFYAEGAEEVEEEIEKLKA